MTTDAEIEIVSDTEAVLTQKGETLRATILSPEGMTFVEESALQEPPQKANKGVRRLVGRLPKGEGALRVAILLSPESLSRAVPES